jgi:hypothetical protein
MQASTMNQQCNMIFGRRMSFVRESMYLQAVKRQGEELLRVTAACKMNEARATRPLIQENECTGFLPSLLRKLLLLLPIRS